MKRNVLLSIVFVLTLGLLLAACSNSSATENSDGKDVITYWSNFNEGEPNQIVLKNIIADYEEENPDVKIEVEWMGRQVMSKVRNAMLSGDGPDLIDKSAAELIGAIGSDTESLNSILDEKIHNEDVVLEDVFLDHVLSLYQDEDKVFFIPFQVISSGFFYDNNLFDENKVEPANNWDEFIQLTEDLKDNDVPPIAHDGNIGFYNAYYFYWLSTRINGPGAFNAAANDETGEAWDDPGFLEVAEKIEDLVASEVFVKGYEGSQFPAAQTQWAQGKAALNLNGSWLPHETGEYASEGFDYNVFPFPEVEGGEGNHSAEIEVIGWAAPEGANMDIVEDFILFGMQEKYQQQIVDDVNNISSRKDLDAPENLQELKEHILDAEEVHKLYDGVEADYPKWWNTVFLATHDKLFFGEITAEEFIDQLKQQTIDYYKN